MKRTIAFFVVMIAVAISVLLSLGLPKTLPGYESVMVVSRQENLIEGEVIESGAQFYYKISKKNAENVLKTLNIEDVDGLVFYYSNKKLDYFKKHFSYLTKASKVGEREVYYGYDKSYYDFRLVDGKKINFQLANDGENWILGYPMILTGF